MALALERLQVILCAVLGRHAEAESDLGARGRHPVVEHELADEGEHTGLAGWQRVAPQVLISCQAQPLERLSVLEELLGDARVERFELLSSAHNRGAEFEDAAGEVAVGHDADPACAVVLLP